MEDSVGNRLVRARKHKGLSRDQVAERLGVSLSTVQSHENDRNQLRPDSLETYARLYGVSIDWIVTGKESESAEIIEIYKAIPNKRERDAWINMGKALKQDKA
jgi:transcriptional regulator with XRE-family HTH domain